MDLQEHFASPYLRAGEAKQGDIVRFLDSGKFEGEGDDKRFQIGVGLLSRDGKIAKQKIFTVNRTNYRTIRDAFGSDTEDWVKKEMQVNIVKVRNPQTGQLVNSIVLTLPNITPNGEVELG